MAPRNEERRREILASTYSLLDEASYDRVSLNDIARGAGIKKSLLQRYFPQKIDIIKEMLTTLLDVSYNYMGTLAQDEEPEGGEAQPDAADELRAIGLWAARILGAAAALLLLVFGTWKRSRYRAAKLERMDAAAVWRRIAAMTRAAGLLPGEDPEGRGFPALAAEAAGGGEDLAVRLEKARETALCRAFSEKGPAPEAEEEAREACRAYGAALYEGLSPLRKFLFRWIYAFV